MRFYRLNFYFCYVLFICSYPDFRPCLRKLLDLVFDCHRFSTILQKVKFFLKILIVKRHTFNYFEQLFSAFLFLKTCAFNYFLNFNFQIIQAGRASVLFDTLKTLMRSHVNFIHAESCSTHKLFLYMNVN